MTNQSAEMARDAGPPDAAVLADMDEANEFDDFDEVSAPVPDEATAAALDGGGPPEWLLTDVDEQDEGDGAAGNGGVEPQTPPASSALPAGAAPDWIDLDDEEADASV